MDKALKALSYDYRMDTVNMIMSGGGGHIGGDMSVMDVLVTLYFKHMNISPACVARTPSSSASSRTSRSRW